MGKFKNRSYYPGENDGEMQWLGDGIGLLIKVFFYGVLALLRGIFTLAGVLILAAKSAEDQEEDDELNSRVIILQVSSPCMEYSMANVNRSAKLYQERRQPGIRSTLRGPGPYLNLSQNPPITLTLAPPFPNKDSQFDDNAPDNTRTAVWPFGDEYDK